MTPSLALQFLFDMPVGPAVASKAAGTAVPDEFAGIFAEACDEQQQPETSPDDEKAALAGAWVMPQASPLLMAPPPPPPQAEDQVALTVEAAKPQPDARGIEAAAPKFEDPLPLQQPVDAADPEATAGAPPIISADVGEDVGGFEPERPVAKVRTLQPSVAPPTVVEQEAILTPLADAPREVPTLRPEVTDELGHEGKQPVSQPSQQPQIAISSATEQPTPLDAAPRIRQQDHVQTETVKHAAATPPQAATPEVPQRSTHVEPAEWPEGPVKPERAVSAPEATALAQHSAPAAHTPSQPFPALAETGQQADERAPGFAAAPEVRRRAALPATPHTAFEAVIEKETAPAAPEAATPVHPVYAAAPATPDTAEPRRDPSSPPAPSAPNLPPVPEQQPTGPVRTLNVRIDQPEQDSTVTLRFAQRAEQVHVHVASSQTAAADTLRRELPDLVAGLDKAGYRSDVDDQSTPGQRQDSQQHGRRRNPYEEYQDYE